MLRPRRSNVKFSRNRGSKPGPNACSRYSTDQDTHMSLPSPITFTNCSSDAGLRAAKRRRRWKRVRPIFLPSTKFRLCPFPESLPSKYSFVLRCRKSQTLPRGSISSGSGWGGGRADLQADRRKRHLALKKICSVLPAGRIILLGDVWPYHYARAPGHYYFDLDLEICDWLSRKATSY